MTDPKHIYSSAKTFETVQSMSLDYPLLTEESKAPEYDKKILDFCFKHRKNMLYLWHGITKVNGIPRMHNLEPIHFIRPYIHFDFDYWTKKSRTQIKWTFKYADIGSSYLPVDLWVKDRYDRLQCLNAIEYCEKHDLWRYDQCYDTIYPEGISWSEFCLRAAMETGADLNEHNVVGWGWESSYIAAA